MKATCITAIILLLVITGCKDSRQTGTENGPGPSQPTPNADVGKVSQDLVLRYNALLIDGYKLNDMTKLQVVTTPELAQKAYYHMAAIAEGKQRMVSDLKKLEFLETDCRQGNKCRVRTRERWDFAYLDIITGARSLDVKNYVYEVSYGLENRNGRWLITEISATGEERKDIPSWKQMFGR